MSLFSTEKKKKSGVLLDVTVIKSLTCSTSPFLKAVPVAFSHNCSTRI